MKNSLIDEIRLYIAEILVSWAISIAGNSKDAANLKKTMYAYFISVVEQHNAEKQYQTIKNKKPSK